MVGSSFKVSPRPDSLDVQESKPANPVGDNSPNELFKKVVLNDAKQNTRLRAKLGGSETSNGKDGSAGYSKGPTKVRFMVCTLGLMALAMSQMCRMVINQAITSMVAETVKTEEISTDGSCPWPEELMVTTPVPASIAALGSSTSLPTSAISTFNPIPGYPTSAPMSSMLSDDRNMEELPDIETILDEEDQSVATTTMIIDEQRKNGTKGAYSKVQRFDWSMREQSTLLGAFYYSYFVFMIIGGRLSEVYGAKYVTLLSVAGSAVINLATPWMARTSLTLLIMSRVLMGAIQSGVFPAMYALIAKWLTMSEASIFAPLIKMNLRVGMVLASFIPGFMPSWQYNFYVSGAISALWSVAWIFFATSDPADNKWVSPGELAHINRKKRKPKQEGEMIEMEEKKGGEKKAAKKAAPSLKTPWLRIWTAPPVIGLIVVKFTFNYGLDFIAIMLPSYLKNVHHATKEQISAITTPVFAIQVFLIVFVGWLAKVSVQRRPFGMTKTTIRKVFQSTASFGIALTYFLMSFNGCNIVYLAIILQLASFLSMFTAGGETMLPYDLSDEYPATIMSIANSIANISGVTTTTLAGIILGTQGGSYDRWNILLRLVAGANLIGGLTFIFLVKAEPIDFDAKSSKKSQQADIESAQATAPALESQDDLKEVALKGLGEPKESNSQGSA